jgi:hypothetical protein
MRKFFNSVESQKIQKEKNRLREKHKRRLRRIAIEKECKSAAEAKSELTSLAELLATKICN